MKYSNVITPISDKINALDFYTPFQTKEGKDYRTDAESLSSMVMRKVTATGDLASVAGRQAHLVLVESNGIYKWVASDPGSGEYYAAAEEGAYWLNVLTVGGGVAENIYTANGTLAADRTVDGGTHALSFQNISNLTLSSTSIFLTPSSGNFVRIANLSTGSTSYDLLAANSSGDIYKISSSAFGFITGITADNGLTASTSTNVRLGGTLISATTIDGGTLYPLTIASNFGTGVGLAAFIATNSGSFGRAIYGSSTNASGGTGVYGNADGSSGTGVVGVGTANGVNGSTTSGNGVYGQSTSGNALRGDATTGLPGLFVSKPSSTSSVTTVIEILATTSGTAANGIGGSVDYFIRTNNNNNRIANQLISKWTNATDASRTSQFLITGINNATQNTLLTLGGEGYMKLIGITSTAASALTAAAGMVVFVTDTNATFTSVGFWGYDGTSWTKF